MSSAIPGAGALGGLGRELAHTALRARNGIKYVAGNSQARIEPTPRQLVWERDKARLWRYLTDAPRAGPPVLVFLGLVSRSYVLDLLPGNSFVARLREAGFDVFMLDWGVADETDADNSFETYVDFYMPRAVDAVRREAGSDEVALLSYCMGSLLALMYVASGRPVPVRALAMLAPPVDFAELTPLVEPLRTGQLDPEELIDDSGLVQASVIRSFFRVRKPTSDVAQYVQMLDIMWNDERLEGHRAMAQWVGDHVPFPGALFRQTVRMLLRDNALSNRTARVGGRAIALDAIDVPMLSIVAEQDHIVPLASATPLKELVGTADFTEVRIPAGHVGLVMGRNAANVTMPALFEFLRSHGDEPEEPHDR